MRSDKLELQRRNRFEDLHMSHAKTWDRGPDRDTMPPTAAYLRFYAWRMAWWADLERAYPDLIKNGVIVWGNHCGGAVYDQRYTQRLSSGLPLCPPALLEDGNGSACSSTR